MNIRRTKSVLGISLILILLWSASACWFWSMQAVAQANIVTAGHDTFVDPNNPTTNYDDQRLEVTYSNFPSFGATRFNLLQFDLSGITTVADQSRLVVEILENNLPAGATVDLAIYTVADDSWTEASVTYTSGPALETLLQTISVASALTGPVSFDDSAVGGYIEQERSGDGTASFGLRLDAGSGALGFGGNLLFEDREGTGDGLNGNEPFIEARPVLAGADLSIVKEALSDTVVVGAELTYTLTISNNGPDLAGTVAVTDDLPTGVDFVSVLPASDCGETAGLVTCQLGNLASGTQMEVKLVVKTTTAGIVTNQAQVSSATIDPVEDNDQASIEVTVNPLSTLQADLQFSKREAEDPVTVGHNITYTLTISNNGPDLARTVVVTDDLPTGVNFVSVQPASGCGEEAGQVTCQLGDLASGDQVEATIVVKTTAAGMVTNQAQVSSATIDPVGDNDEASAETLVNPLPEADLQITKYDAEDPVTLGRMITYTLTISNNGPDLAETVVVTDELPTGVNFVSVQPDTTCGEAGRVVTCHPGDLVSGGSFEVTIIVSPTVTGIITNTARVTAITIDPIADNNDADEQTTVEAVETGTKTYLPLILK